MHRAVRPRIASTMGELLVASARRHRELPALRDDHGIVTYEEMIDRGSRLARVLQGHGLSDGDRVAILTDDDALGLIAYVGVWLAGCAAVCVNARQSAEEVSYILEDSEVEGLLWSTGLSALVDGQPRLGDFRLSLSLDRGPNSELSLLLEAAASEVPEIRIDDRALALLGYTSGTSGRPKGAMMSHASMVVSARTLGQFFKIPPRSRLAFTGSLSFPASFMGQAISHLYLGGMVSLMGRYDVDKWFSVMREDRSTYTYMPSPLAAEFVARITAEPSLLDHLQVVMHGAAPLLRPQLEAVVATAPGRFVEVYGMTELAGCATATAPWMYTQGCEADDVLATVGLPTATVELWIEREDGTRADVGEVGEIVIDGDTLFDGYWKAPEKNAIALADGVFHTGDLGRFDAAGYLYVSGRRSEMIISGGMNVYPAEVERVLLEHPDIAIAAVFGIPHPRWDEGVAAAIQLNPGASLDEQSVVDYCRSRLASYKKPTKVFFLNTLPLTSNLKVNKLELKLRYGGADART